MPTLLRLARTLLAAWESRSGTILTTTRGSPPSLQATALLRRLMQTRSPSRFTGLF
jgi:hypothetical protein